MNSKLIEDAKSVFQLAMIAAYKGEAVSKGVANSLNMPFDEAKVLSVAMQLSQEREQAEDALYEDWKKRKKGNESLRQSFNALVSALAQHALIAISELRLFTPPAPLPGLAVATRTSSQADAKEGSKTNWRLDLIDCNLKGDTRLTLRTDFPKEALNEFVVFGVQTSALDEILTAPDTSAVMASDVVHTLWKGALQTDEDEDEVEIVFPMPDGIQVMDKTSQLNIPLVQDTEGTWAVILKIMDSQQD